MNFCLKKIKKKLRNFMMMNLLTTLKYGCTLIQTCSIASFSHGRLNNTHIPKSLFTPLNLQCSLKYALRAGQNISLSKYIHARHSDAARGALGSAITRPACKNFAKSEIRSATGERNIAPGMPGLQSRRRGGRDNVYSDIASQRVYGEVTHHPRIVSLNGISI